ncbi:hypothetical protein LCGC14_2052570, partial [marine sediment metagenome]
LSGVITNNGILNNVNVTGTLTNNATLDWVIDPTSYWQTTRRIGLGISPRTGIHIDGLPGFRISKPSNENAAIQLYFRSGANYSGFALLRDGDAASDDFHLNWDATEGAATRTDFSIQDTTGQIVLGGSQADILIADAIRKVIILNNGIHVQTTTENASLILNAGTGGAAGNQVSFVDFKINDVLKGNIAVNEANSGQPLEINSAVTNHVVMVNGGGFVGINSGVAVAPPASLYVVWDGNTGGGTYPRGIVSVAHDATVHSAHITGRKARGTLASPTQVLANDYIAGFTAEAHDNAVSWNRVGYMAFRAVDNEADNTLLTFAINIATVETEVVEIRTDGNIWNFMHAIGDGAAITADRWLDVDGSLSNAGENWGIVSTPSLGADNRDIRGAFFRADVDAALTATTSMGVHIENPLLGGGAAITTAYGLYIANITNGATDYAIYTNAGLVHLGDHVLINTISDLGQLHVDQSSVSGAIPVIVADQADLSEEFIDFRTTVGVGYPIDTAALGSYYGKARVAVNGTFKYVGLYDS